MLKKNVELNKRNPLRGNTVLRGESWV